MRHNDVRPLMSNKPFHPGSLPGDQIQQIGRSNESTQEGAISLTSMVENKGVPSGMSIVSSRWSWILLLFAVLILGCSQDAGGPEPGLRSFTVQRGWLTMRDGVRLAATYYIPEANRPGETFPAILEMLPYRKDDSFYIGDYETYSFFARRGFVGVRVDLRGTGSSEGAIVPREYSEIELDDGEQVITQIADQPWSDGTVGMLGISWSANNALMLATRNIPALKAIVIAHASDDLFHDDVHYMDGIFHVDDYESYMESYNFMPQSPAYPIDEDYLRSRLEAYPWFLVEKHQQRDSDFWRKESLRFHYEDLRVPVYIFGGQLDGYRDTVPRLLQYAKVPVKAEMGPYPHAFPTDGVPGPRYEWRLDAIRWYLRWLHGEQNGIDLEPRLNIFVRKGDPPDPELEVASGEWRSEDWPIARTQWTPYFPASGRSLETAASGRIELDALAYKPGAGVAACGPSNWWGDQTGDMASADIGGLVYDSAEISSPVEIIGLPEVHLKVSVDAPLAHWVARLEDVWPDGRVSLVTGAALNGAQRDSRTNPQPLVPGATYDLSFAMHFTTWTFQPKHRIRLLISNAQFPMFWPTPYLMTSKLSINDPATSLLLPVIPAMARPKPVRPAVIPYEEPSDAHVIEDGVPPGYNVSYYDEKTGKTVVERVHEGSFEVQGRKYYYRDMVHHETVDADPANSTAFTGVSEMSVALGDRDLFQRSTTTVRSTATHFHIVINRQIFEGGVLKGDKTWDEVIPRDLQ